jgi:hypothetical protein
MNRILKKTLVIPLLTVFMLTACEQPSGTPDTEGLRTEIERLENEIGRLEFRIYQLESAQGQLAGGIRDQEQTSDTSAEDSVSASTESAEPAPELPRSPPAGRYDLTPVE